LKNSEFVIKMSLYNDIKNKEIFFYNENNFGMYSYHLCILYNNDIKGFLNNNGLILTLTLGFNKLSFKLYKLVFLLLTGILHHKVYLYTVYFKSSKIQNC
jgi:hypothetical protein